MKYQRLGRSALRVSELCLGTMNFGPRTSESDSFAILDCAVASGINLIDTANQYGGSCGVGTTEEIIGQWLQKNSDKRDKLVIATKVHEPIGYGNPTNAFREGRGERSSPPPPSPPGCWAF